MSGSQTRPDNPIHENDKRGAPARTASGPPGEADSFPSEEVRSHRPWLAVDARPRIVLAL